MNEKKFDYLQKHGCLNSDSHFINDELFQKHDFFDPFDLVQVKYEMIRRRKKDSWSVCKACETFGFSRPSYYEIEKAFETGGINGLLPVKRGPKRAHKLNKKVMDFLEETVKKDLKLTSSELSIQLEKTLGVRVHPRSIERALARSKKKL